MKILICLLLLLIIGCGNDAIPMPVEGPELPPFMLPNP